MKQADIKAIAKIYELEQEDFWKHQQSGSWIIKHDAVEKIAKIEKITFSLPVVASSEINNVALVVEATYKETTVWTMGEARQENCKMPYYWAMAEKRGKDRCVLKLLNMYERGLYSSSEADEFNMVGKAPKSGPEVKPITTTVGNDVTEKQKSKIYYECKVRGIDPKQFKVDDLDKTEASLHIENIIGGKYDSQ